MTEEEHYEDVDISDIVDDSEHYLVDSVVDSEPLHTEATDSESLNTIQNSEILHSEEQLTEDKKGPVQKPEVIRSTRLPMARIKNIMKMDPDVNVISGDAVFLVTKATVSIYRFEIINIIALFLCTACELHPLNMAVHH